MTKMFATKPSRSVCAVGIAVSLALSLSSVASAQEAASPDVATPEIASLAAEADPPVFDTPEAALDAFSQALKAEDTLAAIKEGAAKHIGSMARVIAAWC